MNNELIIVTGRSNPALAKSICDYLSLPLGLAHVRRFSDGEILVELGENVRGRDVFVIQSTCLPVNENIMELLILIDALKRASARRITAVIPYYGYARQDRKVAPRVPITAKLIADLITVAGTKRVLSMDLHAGQIQGFFDIPVDHLFAAPLLLDFVREQQFDDIVIISPDAGGVERARAYAKRLDCSIAIIDKRRSGINEVESMTLVGNVEDKVAILVDDMVDTAGTMVRAIDTVLSKGAKTVIALATHAVLSGAAVERIANSSIEYLVVTDTIPLSEEAKKCPKIKTTSVANLLGEAISRIHQEDSVSSLFV
ncbi:MAG: ribose-phosphate pyrophosphokinase [Deltaproteobacteria bacterium]|nr:ribose-phosphate pyrophosphokinase [Deltaproteobacteria bacterium]MBW2051826.1 ribose-phosphate pyrophosphokinase [Deltaproteobacteria bacterium]MBW2140691.1 ribose-phosphate pyrophosphokinase [Deltaproteobacteria bacterium]MBW2322438.1 ribose-phosphate pyrophosphokinase [Deltaproteobacteria bacterium]